MKKFLSNLFWFTISSKLQLPEYKAKDQLLTIIDKLHDGTRTIDQYSVPIREAVDFYLENVHYIE